MKLKELLILVLSAGGVHASTSVINLTVAQLRDTSSSVIGDGGGTWAIIASSVPGAPPAEGSLPGGLTNNSSLASSNFTQIKTDFDGVLLSVGQPDGKNYFIHQIGGFSSEADLGLGGIVQTSITFDIYSASPIEPGFESGTVWGLYWFPGKSQNTVLTGNYEVGGFANDYNAASDGDNWGTTIPAGGSQFAVNFYETDFNQNSLSGGATGLDAARFTAVHVPEPSALILTLFGVAALLRRQRL